MNKLIKSTIIKMNTFESNKSEVINKNDNDAPLNEIGIIDNKKESQKKVKMINIQHMNSSISNSKNLFNDLDKTFENTSSKLNTKSFFITENNVDQNKKKEIVTINEESTIQKSTTKRNARDSLFLRSSLNAFENSNSQREKNSNSLGTKAKFDLIKYLIDNQPNISDIENICIELQSSAIIQNKMFNDLSKQSIDKKAKLNSLESNISNELIKNVPFYSDIGNTIDQLTKEIKNIKKKIEYSEDNLNKLEQKKNEERDKYDQMSKFLKITINEVSKNAKKVRMLNIYELEANDYIESQKSMKMKCEKYLDAINYNKEIKTNLKHKELNSLNEDFALVKEIIEISSIHLDDIKTTKTHFLKEIKKHNKINSALKLINIDLIKSNVDINLKLSKIFSFFSRNYNENVTEKFIQMKMLYDDNFTNFHYLNVDHSNYCLKLRDNEEILLKLNKDYKLKLINEKNIDANNQQLDFEIGLNKLLICQKNNEEINIKVINKEVYLKKLIFSLSFLKNKMIRFIKLDSNKNKPIFEIFKEMFLFKNSLVKVNDKFSKVKKINLDSNVINNSFINQISSSNYLSKTRSSINDDRINSKDTYLINYKFNKLEDMSSKYIFEVLKYVNQILSFIVSLKNRFIDLDKILIKQFSKTNIKQRNSTKALNLNEHTTSKSENETLTTSYYNENKNEKSSRLNINRFRKFHKLNNFRELMDVNSIVKFHDEYGSIVKLRNFNDLNNDIKTQILSNRNKNEINTSIYRSSNNLLSKYGTSKKLSSLNNLTLNTPHSLSTKKSRKTLAFVLTNEIREKLNKNSSLASFANKLVIKKDFFNKDNSGKSETEYTSRSNDKSINRNTYSRMKNYYNKSFSSKNKSKNTVLNNIPQNDLSNYNNYLNMYEDIELEKDEIEYSLKKNVKNNEVLFTENNSKTSENKNKVIFHLFEHDVLKNLTNAIDKEKVNLDIYNFSKKNPRIYKKTFFNSKRKKEDDKIFTYHSPHKEINNDKVQNTLKKTNISSIDNIKTIKSFSNTNEKTNENINKHNSNLGYFNINNNEMDTRLVLSDNSISNLDKNHYQNTDNKNNKNKTVSKLTFTGNYCYTTNGKILNKNINKGTLTSLFSLD